MIWVLYISTSNASSMHAFMLKEDAIQFLFDATVRYLEETTNQEVKTLKPRSTGDKLRFVDNWLESQSGIFSPYYKLEEVEVN